LWVTGEYFDAFRAAELAARGRLDSDPDPHARLAWFKRIWEQAPPGERPLIARARSGSTEAWLFLARTRPQQAVGLAHPRSGRFAPVFAGEPDEPMKQALLRAAARRLRNFGLARLALAPLLSGDALLLAAAFRHGGWTVSDRGAGISFLLETDSRSFDEIWDAAPDRLHQRVSAGARQFHVEVSDLLTPRLWDEVELLAGPDPFLRDLAQDATLDRTLRLGLVHIGEVPVAAQLWTVEGATAVRHWHGVDPDARHLHAGDHLTEAMLRYLINVDGAARLDLGTGREAELGDWATGRLPLVRLDLFNPRAASAWGPALAARTAALVRRRRLD